MSKNKYILVAQIATMIFGITLIWEDALFLYTRDPAPNGVWVFLYPCLLVYAVDCKIFWNKIIGYVIIGYFTIVNFNKFIPALQGTYMSFESLFDSEFPKSGYYLINLYLSIFIQRIFIFISSLFLLVGLWRDKR
jgi:hypothetical protein